MVLTSDDQFRKHAPFFFIVIVGLMIRLYHIDLPLLDSKPHREIHTAEETRNLYYQPQSFLYPTSKLWGDEPGFYIAEFPLYNALVATIYELTGGVAEVWGRLVSVISSVGTAIFFYLLVTELFGSMIAVYAVTLFYLVSPQEIILSRSFQPDQFGFFLGLTAIYAFVRWVKSRRLSMYLLSFITMALTLLVKISLFPFLFPLFSLSIERFGKTVFKKPLVTIYGLSILPSLIWYAHVKNVYSQFPNLHSAALISPQNWLTFGQLLDIHWYVNLFYGFVENVTTVPVFLLTVMGTFISWRRDTSRIIWFWLLGLTIYGLAFIGKIHFWYYQVPFLFPLTILSGIAIHSFYPKVKKFIPLPRVFAITGLGLVMITTGRPYLLRAYTIAPQHQFVLEVAQEVRQFAPPSSKIIASSANNAALTYYSLRPDLWGATLDINDSTCDASCTIDKFEQFRKWGATVYAVSNKSELENNPTLSTYLMTRYRLLKETPAYVIFDLQSPRD